MTIRIGQGFDAHRFSPDGSIIVGGVVVDTSRGVLATSDGDVAAHALCDALLGAAALGDLGDHFPSSDQRWHDADSLQLLAEVARLLAAAGFSCQSVDVTVIVETTRISPHRPAIRQRLADVLHLDPAAVSVKATTTDGLGWLGRNEGIAASAIAVVTTTP